MKLLFLTGNEHKAQEAAAILTGHEVEARKIDLPELQSLDPEEIILEKLAVARRRVKEKDVAILVEDVSFWIGDTGLPGPFIKWFNQTIMPSGLPAFGKAFDTDRARAACHLGVILPNRRKPLFFTGIVKGRLVAPRGESGFGFDVVFEPDGWDKTYAEMTQDEKNGISHRGKAFAQLKEHLLVQANIAATAQTDEEQDDAPLGSVEDLPEDDT